MGKYTARNADNIILTVVFGVFSLLAVVLRFLARSRTQAPYAADDWLIVGSLLTFFVWTGLFVWGL